MGWWSIFSQVQGPFVFFASELLSAHSSAGSWIFPRLLDSVPLTFFCVWHNVCTLKHTEKCYGVYNGPTMLVMRMDLLSWYIHPGVACLNVAILQSWKPWTQEANTWRCVAHAQMGRSERGLQHD